MDQVGVPGMSRLVNLNFQFTWVVLTMLIIFKIVLEVLFALGG